MSKRRAARRQNKSHHWLHWATQSKVVHETAVKKSEIWRVRSNRSEPRTGYGVKGRNVEAARRTDCRAATSWMYSVDTVAPTAAWATYDRSWPPLFAAVLPVFVSDHLTKFRSRCVRAIVAASSKLPYCWLSQLAWWWNTGYLAVHIPVRNHILAG